jgi:hypothetical protein
MAAQVLHCVDSQSTSYGDHCAIYNLNPKEDFYKVSEKFSWFFNFFMPLRCHLDITYLCLQDTKYK